VSQSNKKLLLAMNNYFLFIFFWHKETAIHCKWIKKKHKNTPPRRVKGDPKPSYLPYPCKQTTVTPRNPQHFPLKKKINTPPICIEFLESAVGVTWFFSDMPKSLQLGCTSVLNKFRPDKVKDHDIPNAMVKNAMVSSNPVTPKSDALQQGP
jgi:hypothetical protein